MAKDANSPTKHDDSKQISPEREVLECFARAAANVYFPPTDGDGNPSVGRYLIDNGKLPSVDDEIKPWEYPGWLVPYIQLSEDAHSGIASRYGYLLRTLESGHLLDEPLPQVKFVGEGSPEAKPGMKMLADMIKIVETRTGYSRSIEEVCRFLGWGLKVCDEKPNLSDDALEALYRLFDVSKWLLAPTDYIGQHMAEVSYGRAGGFFPTPMNVCEMMTRMNFLGMAGDRRILTVNDPCVGTGRFLMTASNYSMRLSGNDINWLCVLATKINLALFAPWSRVPEAFYPVTTEAQTAYEASNGQKQQPRGRNEQESGIESPAEVPDMTPKTGQLSLF